MTIALGSHHWKIGLQNKTEGYLPQQVIQHSDLIGTIEFADGAFVIVGNGHRKNKTGQLVVNNSAPLYDMDTQDVEILGNVHQNPELLEVEK